MIKASGKDAGIFARDGHIEHARSDIIAVAIAEGKPARALEDTTIGTNVAFLAIVGIEHHGVEANVEIVGHVIIGIRIDLAGEIQTTIHRFRKRPEVVAKHIQETFVLRVDDNAVVIEAKAGIKRIALRRRDGRESGSPSFALVFRNENSDVVTVAIDASHINHIVVGGGDGDVDQTGGFGQQAVAFQHIGTGAGV